MEQCTRAWADIDLDAIVANIQNVRSRVGEDKKIMAVVKADGYGHGAVPISKTLTSYVDYFGVATLQEGLELRQFSVQKPILILGANGKEQIQEAIEADLAQTVFQEEAARFISQKAKELGKTAVIHIKIDTGMTRLGFDISKISVQAIKRILLLDCVYVEGIYTHFACADMEDKSYSHLQMECFLTFLKLLDQEGIAIPIKHMSNSAGIIDLPKADCDMVRCGIATYGLYPSNEVQKDHLQLNPSMKLYSRITFVKEVEANVGVSYGSTYVTTKKTKIATVPIGYGDGYPWRLSSKGRVLVKGRSVPILGRICMDQFMIDVTEFDQIAEGELVTLVGEDGEEAITIEELAELAGTFNYEFICDLGKRIFRNYYFQGKKISTLNYKPHLEEV